MNNVGQEPLIQQDTHGLNFDNCLRTGTKGKPPGSTQRIRCHQGVPYLPFGKRYKSKDPQQYIYAQFDIFFVLSEINKISEKVSVYTRISILD